MLWQKLFRRRAAKINLEKGGLCQSSKKNLGNAWPECNQKQLGGQTVEELALFLFDLGISLTEFGQVAIL